MSTPVRFLHTADWQVGKPFGRVEDVEKRAHLQTQRLSVIQRLGTVARNERAQFVVVSGDLFDSPQPSQSHIAAACSAIGQVELPVYVIPGNHDHAGLGSVWETPFFRRQRDELAPNLNVLLNREPCFAPGAVIFPCPLLRRHEPMDPTEWLRVFPSGEWDPSMPRIVLAHGSIQAFESFQDDEEVGSGPPNLLYLDRLDKDAIDYTALGDWHGTRQVGAKAWYSGTPEMDRFPKSDVQDPGNVLVVTVSRGGEPVVNKHRTTALEWHRLDWEFRDDQGLGQLEEVLREKLGQRVNKDLLRLHLRGSLGLEAFTQLEQHLESWMSRLIRLRIDNAVVVAPTDTELEALTMRTQDPLIARVAGQLAVKAVGDSDEASVARLALRELHLLVQNNQES
jgi:DNA repair exonuclease SbcCD nuclease subunit